MTAGPHAGPGPAGPAARAGVRAGDIILRLGDRPVSNRFDVERALWTQQPGATVDARILRDGQPMRASITLGASAERELASSTTAFKPTRPAWALPTKTQPAKDPP